MPQNPKRKKEPRPPTCREQTEGLAESGQIDALLKELATGWSGPLFNGTDEAALIRRAISFHTRKGVTATCDAAFLTMIAINLECLARVELGLLRKLDQVDRHCGSRACESPPASIQPDLDRLAALQDSLLAAMKRYSSIRHTASLAEHARPTPRTSEQPIKPNERKIIDFAEAIKAVRGGDGT